MQQDIPADSEKENISSQTFNFLYFFTHLWHWDDFYSTWCLKKKKKFFEGPHTRLVRQMMGVGALPTALLLAYKSSMLTSVFMLKGQEDNTT